MSKTFPMYECPSFNVCSAPLCPLDPDRDERVSSKGEDKCRANRPTRERIGEKHANLLPYKGLTKREYDGKKRWEGLPPQKKKLIAERAAKLNKSGLKRKIGGSNA